MEGGTPTVAAFALSPIKERLQLQGEGCDGRFVQASHSDASKCEHFSTLLQRMFSFFGWGRGVSLQTLV